ncbi:hypothetical protein JCM8097_009065 [Rhodosporidiobolus ruineniae]
MSPTSTSSASPSPPTKPLPFRFSSLEDAAKNLRDALDRRKYHFKVDLNRRGNKNTVYTLSVKEWSKTIRCSLPQSRLEASRTKEKKRLPIPLIEECVKSGFVVIQDFLDDVLVDSSSDNSTSIDLAAAFPQALKREFRLKAPDRPQVVGVSYVSVRDAWSELLRAGEEVGYFVKHPDTSPRQTFTRELPLHYRPQDVAYPYYPFLTTLKDRTVRPNLILEASFTVQIADTSFELLGPAPVVDRKLLAQIFDLCLHRGIVTLDHMSSYSRPATFTYTVVDTSPAAASPSSGSADSRSPSPPPTPAPSPASPSDAATFSYHDLLAVYSSSSGDSADLTTSVDLAKVEPAKPAETPSRDELDAELAELAAIEAFLESHVEVDESDKSASNALHGVEATTGSPGDGGESAESTLASVEVEQEERVEVDSVADEAPEAATMAPVEAQDDDATRVVNDSRVKEKPVGELEEETKPLRAQ